MGWMMTMPMMIRSQSPRVRLRLGAEDVPLAGVLVVAMVLGCAVRIESASYCLRKALDRKSENKPRTLTTKDTKGKTKAGVFSL